MEDTIKGVFIDPRNELVIEVVVNNDAISLKKLLNAENINVVTKKINNKFFSIVCNDESIDEIPSIISAVNNYDCILGKAFICNSDSWGNLTSLSQNDINKLILLSRTFIYKDEVKFKAIFNFSFNL